MEKTKLTVIAKILMFCSLLNVLCFPLLGEDDKQSETNMNAEIKQKEEEAAKLLVKIGENAKKYPKIGVNLHSVRWADVEKCIKQIKEDKLGDNVGIFGIGYGKNETVNEQLKTQLVRTWRDLCDTNGLFLSGEAACCDIGYIAEWALAIQDHNHRARRNSMSDMLDAKTKYVNGVRGGIVGKRRAAIVPRIVGVMEAGPIGLGEGLEGGGDFLFAELLWIQTGMSMSSARGATKAYEKTFWATWLNTEFSNSRDHMGPPKDNAYTPAHQRRLMLDYILSYIYGANLIILQDCLFDIGIAHCLKKEWPTYDMNSPQCKGFRLVAHKFYEYAQTHPRSEQSPVVDIGVVYGNLDGTPCLNGIKGDVQKRQIWWQKGSEWKPTIERGWERIYDMLTIYGPPVEAAMRYAGTPYGQFDIVPIRAPIDVLQKYKTLIFLGWNTMTPEIYGKLKEYVKNGGTLFMSLPQLSQQIERKPELELINNGDFKDLFGVKVKGKLEHKADEKAANVVRFDQESLFEQCKFPVGTTFEYNTEMIPSAGVTALMKEMELLSGKTEDESGKTFQAGIDWSAGVEASLKGRLPCPTGETKPGFFEYPSVDGDFIKWQSVVVPENIKGEKVTFIMAAGMGGFGGTHELFINGRKILEVNPSFGATINWQSELAMAKFETTYINTGSDIFGIFSVTVNPEIIEYGKRQNFEMKGKSGSSYGGYFSISEVKNPEALKVNELRAKTKKILFGPDLEWADMQVEGAKVLASVNDGKIPVLIENKSGNGVAYLMATYSFSPVPAEFIKPLLVGTVKTGDVELLGYPGEKEAIAYAVYPGKGENEETKILLVNIDWTEADNVKNVKLRIKDMVMPLAVKEGAIKTINVLGDLALTVSDDLNHCLSLDKRDGSKYTGKLSGQGICVIKGTVRGNKGPQKVTLDGKDILFKYDSSSHSLTAECNLWSEHMLEITM